jgi:hypothetical protein
MLTKHDFHSFAIATISLFSAMGLSAALIANIVGWP